MHNDEFKFKHFKVCHHRSSMKVGVDGVLIGGWSEYRGKLALDVGTGCGLIALMLAQRNNSIKIHAIDIDSHSIEEAAVNFRNSNWSERLKAELISLEDFYEKTYEKFDLIVSNPPFYKSGVEDLKSPRIRARHEGALKIETLIKISSKLLNVGGKLSFIIPEERFEEIMKMKNPPEMILNKICKVKHTIHSPVKRVMVEYVNINLAEKEKITLNEEFLIMFNNDRTPTKKYRDLYQDFYLKF